MVPLSRPCVKTERDYTFCESISHMSTSIGAIYKYRADLGEYGETKDFSYIFGILHVDKSETIAFRDYYTPGGGRGRRGQSRYYFLRNKQKFIRFTTLIITPLGYCQIYILLNTKNRNV